MIKQARKYHKWLMAFIGIQFLFWSITGLYMVSLDIHYIHGEPLQKQASHGLQLKDVSFSINSLLSRYPDAKNIEVARFMDKQVYRFSSVDNQKVMVDAFSGEQLPIVNELLARAIARNNYVGTEKVASVRLISNIAEKPSELSPRHLPVWQVTFDHFASPTFYISQQSGVIVTKRHNFWRLFDWMWRFHIMDYDDGENVSNWLLLVIALLGMLAAIAGAVLTYFRVLATKQGGTA